MHCSADLPSISPCALELGRASWLSPRITFSGSRPHVDILPLSSSVPHSQQYNTHFTPYRNPGIIDNQSMSASASTSRKPAQTQPTPNMSLSQIAYILAALTAGGGITGYARAGSIPSLAAGCSVGALYALGGYRIQNRQSYGVELALLASVVLAGSSIPRALKSRKPLPMGLSVLAAFGLWNFGVAFANSRR